MAIRIYTDGSCIGNPGPGAWAYLIKIGTQAIRAQGGETLTTNNRMELLAVIEALSTVEKKHPKDEEIHVYSDSSWVIKTLTDNWKRKKNLDLWAELTPLLVGKNISWHWVKGHAGHPENEDCDERAQKEANRQKKLAKKSGAYLETLPQILPPSLFD